jgi:cysteine desulfurase / selenocysteine lyase
MFKEMFPHSAEVTYLDTAAEGLLAPGVSAALQDYCRAKSFGTPGRKEFHEVEKDAIALSAKILGTNPSNIALVGSASEGLNVLATSIDWREGDQIIINDLEFPSNVVPWLRLSHLGVELVVVESQEGILHWDVITERISARTRLIALSLVSYKTGTYFPFVQRISEEARKVGALLAVDATQALGRCPVNIEGIDYLVSSSYKWLLAPHGLGVVYVSPEFRRSLNPASVGWYSIRNLFSKDRFKRYELKDGAGCLSVGMPNFPAIYGLRRSLEFLQQVDFSKLYDELKPLIEQLRRGLSGMGLDVLSPPQAEYASGIISFSHQQAEHLGAELEKEKVVVWAGDGRVRASVHLYNDMNDIERYTRVLANVLSRVERFHV